MKRIAVDQVQCLIAFHIAAATRRGHEDAGAIAHMCAIAEVRALTDLSDGLALLVKTTDKIMAEDDE